MNSHSQTESSLDWCQDADGASQVIATAGQHDVHAVAQECEETHPPQAVVLLEHGERTLDSGTDPADHSIASLLSLRQFGMMFVGSVHQAVLDAGLGQTRMAGVGVIGLIAINR